MYRFVVTDCSLVCSRAEINSARARARVLTYIVCDRPTGHHSYLLYQTTGYQPKGCLADRDGSLIVSPSFLLCILASSYAVGYKATHPGCFQPLYQHSSGALISHCRSDAYSEEVPLTSAYHFKQTQPVRAWRPTSYTFAAD